MLESHPCVVVAKGQEDPAAQSLFPLEFVDAHHHFIDTSENSFQKGFLASLNGNNAVYLPQDYHRDVVEPLQRELGTRLVASVHVECLPDNGLEEAHWVESLVSKHNNDSDSSNDGNNHHHHHCTVAGIVASVDLASPRAAEDLAALRANCPLVKGIRWILDYDADGGPYDAHTDTATHVATTRHAPHCRDYLRSGPPFGQVLPALASGFALLHEYGYSFDLQCAPEQLEAATELFAKHPHIPVVINHLAKPRKVCVCRGETKDDGVVARINDDELSVWRRNIHRLAQLNHVYMKLSMLGYAVPNWYAGQHPSQKATVVELVQTVVDAFGASRCMVALNWWKNAALSDSDGLGTIGPSPVEYVRFLTEECFGKYSRQERAMLFAGTAKRFYKLS